MGDSAGKMDRGEDEAANPLKLVLEVLQEAGFLDQESEEPVVRFLHPEELQEKIQPALGDEPLNPSELRKILENIVKYSVRTFSPHFHNQLYAGVDVYGTAGAWLTEALNTSQYTYEVAPVFTLLEREIIGNALALAGYPGLPEGDGILSPGGSLSNMYGMLLARYHYFPDVKRKGLSGLPPLAVFTSDDSHYSITKGAHWLGIGTDNIYRVRTDDYGRMIPSHLRRSITESRKAGKVPFFVNATAGTTVLGSFDPLDKIAEICRDEDVWLHVDACLGGTLLLSDKYRDRLRGIELSNSMSWNPHKMLGAPLQCSLFLVRGKNALHEANCAGAKYLFMQDKFYDVSWDTGDKSVQCGRKVDALKLWLMWKARGTRGLRSSVDAAMEVAEYFYERIKEREGFRLVIPRFQGANVCFWYVPPKMRVQAENDAWKKRLYAIAPTIKERMIKSGSLMIGYTPLAHKGHGNFFRMVVGCQPTPTTKEMDYVIEQIEQHGSDLGD